MTRGEPDDVARFSIAEAARRIGVPVATLRSWNTRYGLAPTGHRSGRHRLYSSADLQVLTRMVALIRSGVTARSAAATVAGPILVERAEGLVEAAFALDARAVAGQLDGHLSARGVVATWERLCRPALVAVATRQIAGESCIDVEHLLSWCIVAALHRVTVHRMSASARVPGRIVLACTGGEQHTLPLEAIRAALAERGAAARMLGADVPVAALADALGRAPEPGRVLLWSQHESTGSAASVKACIDCGAKVFIAGPGWSDTRLPVEAVPVDGLADAVTALLAE